MPVTELTIELRGRWRLAILRISTCLGNSATMFLVRTGWFDPKYRSEGKWERISLKDEFQVKETTR